jgi:hypothetical protein
LTWKDPLAIVEDAKDKDVENKNSPVFDVVEKTTASADAVEVQVVKGASPTTEEGQDLVATEAAEPNSQI